MQSFFVVFVSEMLQLILLVMLCSPMLALCYSSSLKPLMSRRLSRKHAVSEQATSAGTFDKLVDLYMQQNQEPVPGASSVSEYIPPEVGAEIYVGSIVALIPIVWATIEFTSRIRTQQQCLLCNGSGLVYVTAKGSALNRPRKCTNCGGFLPWLGWKAFFLSNFDIGNGGVLLRPARNYEEVNAKIREEKAKASDNDVKVEADNAN